MNDMEGYRLGNNIAENYKFYLAIRNQRKEVINVILWNQVRV